MQIEERPEWVADILSEALEDESVSLVTIQGRSPGLLMHNPRSMLQSAGKSKKRTEIPTPEEEAEIGAYRLPSGELYLPSEAVYGAIVRASGYYKIGRYSAKSAVAGSVKVRPLRIPLGTDEYEVDIRTAVVQRSRIVRARPNLPEWKAPFALVYDPSYGADRKLLYGALQDAGRKVGLLDFRPQTMGPFGTFDILTWDDIKEAAK